MLNQSYLRARLDYYAGELEMLPTGRVLKHNQRDYYIVRTNYSATNKHYERAINSEKGKQDLKLLRRREEIDRLNKKYIGIWQGQYKELYKYNPNYVKPHNSVSLLPGSYWEQALRNKKSEEAKDEMEYKYFHNGVKMRSRAEVLIAEIVASYDLEYAYEVRIRVGNQFYDADFVVYVPELDCCFVIEFLGMMSNVRYFSLAMDKYRNYICADYKPNIDIIFLYGGIDEMPDPAHVRAMINAVLEYISNVL